MPFGSAGIENRYQLQQPQLLGPLQDHPNRRRLPLATSSGCPFTHGLQPVAEGMKRHLGIGAFDACDDSRQTVIFVGSGRAGKDGLGQQTLADEGFGCTDQAGQGPRLRLARQA